MTWQEAKVGTDGLGAPAGAFLNGRWNCLPFGCGNRRPRIPVLAIFGEALALRGYQPASMVGRPVPELFPDEPVELLEPTLEKAFEGLENSLESAQRTGQLVSVRNQAGLRRRRSRGRPRFPTEITHRKLAEEHAAEERSSSRTFSTASAIWCWSRTATAGSTREQVLREVHGNEPAAMRSALRSTSSSHRRSPGA